MENESSGFVNDLKEEITADKPMDTYRKFTDLHEYYVSESGPARLFTAVRYDKLYVLKCLRPEFLYTPVYRQALVKEFEIGLLIDHPHICRTIGMEDVDGLGPTIIMEYVDGDTLREIMDKGLLTTDFALHLTRQLMDALEYLHCKQVIHRDLKPENIIITHNGRNVKLIDFSLSDSDAHCVLKCPAGSLNYIAPEQLLPDARPNVKSDIYSLGMVVNGMAEATGSCDLRRIAKICIRHDPAARPASVSQIMPQVQRSYRSHIYLSLLIAAVVVLSGYIAATLYRHAQTVAIHRTNDSGAVSIDGNRAVDFQTIQEITPRK